MADEEQVEETAEVAEPVDDRRAEILKAMGDDEPASETVSDAETVTTSEVEEVPSTEAVADTETASVAATETAADPLDAPEHWALEHQEMFRKLDPAAQSFLLDRGKEMEAAHTKRSQEIAPLRTTAERWQPYLDQIQATPDRMFDSVMNLEYQLRTGTNGQKISVLQQLAQSYGVDLGEPANGNGQKAPTAEEDPFNVHGTIRQYLEPLQQQIQQVSGGFQQQNQAQQQQAVTGAQQRIDAFRDEAGADGKAAHPYFQEVLADMNQLAVAQTQAQPGQPVDIAALYERACWSNPSVRAKMQAAENHKSQQAKRKTEQERGKRARAATGGLAGGGGGGGQEQPKDRRAAIEAAWEQAAAS